VAFFDEEIRGHSCHENKMQNKGQRLIRQLPEGNNEDSALKAEKFQAHAMCRSATGFRVFTVGDSSIFVKSVRSAADFGFLRMKAAEKTKRAQPESGTKVNLFTRSLVA
jgi:hypothetical protein